MKSETAFYRAMLTRKREARQHQSTAVMIVCVTLQMLWLVAGGLLPAWGLLSLDTFFLFCPLVFGVLIGIFGLFGFLIFRRAARPITTEEVAHLRQSERVRLFQQAQGILPPAYRPWRIALEVFVGLLLAAGGISCLIFSLPDKSLLKYLYAFSLHGTALYLLHMALYDKPRRAIGLAAEAAQELRRRLSLGETSEISETQDTHQAM